MEIQLDTTLRKKLLCVINPQRAFFFEFPADADINELFGVVSKLKTELWTAIGKERETKEQAEAEIAVEVVEEEVKD